VPPDDDLAFRLRLSFLGRHRAAPPARLIEDPNRSVTLPDQRDQDPNRRQTKAEKRDEARRKREERQRQMAKRKRTRTWGIVAIVVALKSSTFTGGSFSSCTNPSGTCLSMDWFGSAEEYTNSDPHSEWGNAIAQFSGETYYQGSDMSGDGDTRALFANGARRRYERRCGREV
jgi:hypothetical protein